LIKRIEKEQSKNNKKEYYCLLMAGAFGPANFISFSHITIKFMIVRIAFIMVRPAVLTSLYPGA
jgi:hypothetical protein